MIYQKPVQLRPHVKELVDMLTEDVNKLRSESGKHLRPITRGDLIEDALVAYNVKRGLKI